MFLSSRAIAQASITRDFLHRLEQEGIRMPLGPVIISPHGLLPSLYREMILRRPHDFKIGCLQVRGKCVYLDIARSRMCVNSFQMVGIHFMQDLEIVTQMLSVMKNLGFRRVVFSRSILVALSFAVLRHAYRHQRGLL